MKIAFSKSTRRALTLVELLVVIAVLMIFSAMIFSGADFANAKPRALRIQCVNNLKQTGLAFRIWAGDHGDKFPMELSETNGGTLEFTSGPTLFRHFQVLSNELFLPRCLMCPADDVRSVGATNFASLNNSNISFFVGLDTSTTNAQGLLSGDCNITNGTLIRNGIFRLNTNQPAGWTAGTHNKVGNLLMADGSVQQASQIGLRNAVQNSGVSTNHLQMPVLTP